MDISLASSILTRKVVSSYEVNSTVGAKMDTQISLIDLSNKDVPDQGLLASFISISAKSVGNATAPGTSRTFTVNAYWSDEKLADSSTVPTVLSDRKIGLATKALPNSASATRQWEISGPTLIRGAYLYLSLDHTTVDASASVSIDLNVNRVP